MRPAAGGVERPALVATIAALAMTAGCSWIFVQPLPADHRGFSVANCTSSRTAPVLDTLFATTNVLSAIYVATENNVTNKGTAVGLGLGVATLWALSAGYGYSHTSECEDAQEEDGRSYHPLPHVRARPQAPPPYAAPQPAPAPYAPPEPPPGVPSTPAQPEVQQSDSDEPPARPAADPDVPLPDRPRPKKSPERLDAPRFGN